ncbi:hypothetical protein [Nitrospira sp. Nam74]
MRYCRYRNPTAQRVAMSRSGMFKKEIQQGRSERGAGTHSSQYVRGSERVGTKLEALLNIP